MLRKFTGHFEDMALAVLIVDVFTPLGRLADLAVFWIKGQPARRCGIAGRHPDNLLGPLLLENIKLVRFQIYVHDFH